MHRLQRRLRWLLGGLSVVVPVILYRVLAERASWMPRTIYKTTKCQSPHDYSLVDGTISPDGHTMAAAEWIDGHQDILLRNLDTARMRRIRQPTDAHSIAFAPDGKTLATSGGGVGPSGYDQDVAVRLWDVAQGRIVRVLPGAPPLYGSQIIALAFAPDGQTVAAGTGFGGVRMWDPATGRLKHTLQTLWQDPHAIDPDPSNTLTIAFSPDSNTLATGGDTDGSIKLWDVRSGRLRKTWRGGAGQVAALTFAPQGNVLASISLDGTVRVRAMSTGQVRLALKHAVDYAGIITFSPDGKLLVTSAVYAPREIRLWDMPSGRLRSSVQGNSASFSPDGQTLATTVMEDVAPAGTIGKVVLTRMK